MGINEMIAGAVHRYPGIYLTAGENSRKPQLGDRLIKGLCDQSYLQMGSLFLQIRSVGSHSTSGREKERIKERMGFDRASFYKSRLCNYLQQDCRNPIIV